MFYNEDMDPIKLHDKGAAVEDVQARLLKLGYDIDAAEKTTHAFEKSTQAAVSLFRSDVNLPEGDCVDNACWEALVDATYTLGDRTLYLRLPNFHGNDVKMLQNALNVLGFHAGAIDGVYGAHTEAAVKQFQENIGELGDGMCFPDTAQAVLRLHHVWEGQDGRTSPLAGTPLGFARAAEVLETCKIGLLGSDPITRSIAARVWNLASATTENSGLVLLNSEESAGEEIEFLCELTCQDEHPKKGTTLVAVSDLTRDLGIRISMAREMSQAHPPHVLLKMPNEVNDYSGGFTAAKAQTLASVILDALCSALSRRASL